MESVIKKAEPLHIQSYHLIKNAIINGEFTPEKRITETELSQKLGVSRGTIRESIKMLLQDGLLVQKNNHLTIFEPTLEIAIDLYLCREKLESLAAKLASLHITEDEKVKLKAIIKETKEALQQENNRTKVSELNTEFHELIVTCSRNKELLQLMNVIRSKIAFVRNSLHRNYVRTDRFIKEHEEVAQAIIQHNQEKAEQLMALHIQNDLKAINKLFEQTN